MTDKLKLGVFFKETIAEQYTGRRLTEAECHDVCKTINNRYKRQAFIAKIAAQQGPLADEAKELLG